MEALTAHSNGRFSFIIRICIAETMSSPKAKSETSFGFVFLNNRFSIFN